MKISPKNCLVFFYISFFPLAFWFGLFPYVYVAEKVPTIKHFIATFECSNSRSICSRSMCVEFSCEKLFIHYLNRPRKLFINCLLFGGKSPWLFILTIVYKKNKVYVYIERCSQIMTQIIYRVSCFFLFINLVICGWHVKLLQWLSWIILWLMLPVILIFKKVVKKSWKLQFFSQKFYYKGLTFVIWTWYVADTLLNEEKSGLIQYKITCI